MEKFIKTKCLIAFLCILSCFGFSHVSADQQPVSFWFVNVGKADACIIQCGDHVCLYDTGTKKAYTQLKAVLTLLDTKKIDSVFLSHSHSDHTGGFKKLCDGFEVCEWYRSAFPIADQKDSDKWDKFVEKTNANEHIVRAGETIEWADCVAFEILGPLQSSSEENDQSLVIACNVYGRRILMTGDMQFAEEFSLLKAGVDLKCDVLKVGNHGNPDASSQAFAQAANPSVIVISTDTSNDKDSANSRVITSFTDAEVYITQDDELGVLITVNPDGELIARYASAER